MPRARGRDPIAGQMITDVQGYTGSSAGACTLVLISSFLGLALSCVAFRSLCVLVSSFIASSPGWSSRSSSLHLAVTSSDDRRRSRRRCLAVPGRGAQLFLVAARDGLRIA